MPTTTRITRPEALEELEHRVHMLEQRLARLEAPPRAAWPVGEPGAPASDHHDPTSLRAIAVGMRLSGASRTDIVQMLGDMYESREVEAVLDETDHPSG